MERTTPDREILHRVDVVTADTFVVMVTTKLPTSDYMFYLFFFFAPLLLAVGWRQVNGRISKDSNNDAYVTARRDAIVEKCRDKEDNKERL